jgi:hypothetical protein
MALFKSTSRLPRRASHVALAASIVLSFCSSSISFAQESSDQKPVDGAVQARTAPVQGDGGAAGPSTKQDIPDALKDLVPKDASTLLSSPPDSAKKDSPVIRSSTQPLPSALPSSAGASQQKTAVTPGSSAPKHYTLRGRLEEIGGRGASLPAGVVLNLKTRTAKVDPSFERKIEGKVASFPMDWRGSWSGPIKVWANQFDPAYFDFDREEAEDIEKVLAPNTTGTVTFNFFQQNNSIALQPATIVFPPRTNSPVSNRMQQELRSSPLGQMMGGNQQMLSMLTATQSAMVLGDLNGGMSSGGNSLSLQVVKNDLRELKPGVLEQNLVVEASERHRQTGEVRKSLDETVLRFTKLSPTSLYVQVANLSYSWDGRFLSKVVMYGTMNKGAGYASPSVIPYGLPGGMPGGFPGLSPSGGGVNMNDLNNLIKQMQGL